VRDEKVFRGTDVWGDFFCERAALAVQAAEHLIYQLDKNKKDELER
jgi:hypothetical protein